MFFSLIVSVYNRPDEVRELLKSIEKQIFDRQKISFEVLVVEDGSTLKAEEVIKDFAQNLNIRYFFKENTGQGFSRNYAFKYARGDYFIILDSDCLLPPNYLQNIYNHLQHTPLDAFGGPDTAHESFTDTQKAINYAITSLFSTGGVRGNKYSVEKFRPRSFNMGISRKVWETIGGFALTRMGEDIEFSIRIEKAGFRIGLIPDAFVYHKRRKNFKEFYKQLHSFGRTRIDLWRLHPDEFKFVHCLPALFVLFLFSIPFVFLLNTRVGILMISALGLYLGLIFIDALFKTKNLKISAMASWAVLVQLTAYGIGFLTEIFQPTKR